jgi:hypothetical protein
VIAHMPEIESWENFERIEARAALEIIPAGEGQTSYGVLRFTADTDTNLELRLVAVENIEITDASFQDANAARTTQLDKLVRQLVQPANQTIPLDVIMSYVGPEIQLTETSDLSFEPPPIFYATTPARLLITDGEPILAPIPDTKLKYVVNTNWDLFLYKDKTWYLRDEKRWLKSKGKDLSGEWKYTTRLPAPIKKLPDDENWKAVRQAIPAEKTKDDEPTIFVSERPAELILILGRPNLSTVGGPGLEYIANTESGLFQYKKQYYYLVSGRWFQAETLRGPWSHVAKLPEIFATIPADHEKGHVLVAVPNTQEAILAAMEATIPRKATVRRDAGKSVSVVYNGDPDFQLIQPTMVYRAINSPNDIFKVNDKYYLCDNAVWYIAVTPDGPWEVATSVPDEIYSIPATSPAHHVTYVYIYESDKDTVSSGYTSGYYGVHVSYGVVVYGSGYYYSPYYYHNPYYNGYPVYYPYGYSYGASAWYNPTTGRYGRSASVYGPYGGYGRSASYNPKTGSYARGAAVWDNNEIAASAAAYNPRSGTGVATNQYRSEYGGRGESLITRDDKWVQTQSAWDQSGNRTTDFNTSEGGTGEISRNVSGDTVSREGSFSKGDQSLETKSVRNDQGAAAIGARTGDGSQGGLIRTESGDLYAGKDGQVYKRGDDGWYQRSGEDWNQIDVPTERAAQIEQRRGEQGSNRANGDTSRGDFRTGENGSGQRDFRTGQAGSGQRDFRTGTNLGGTRNGSRLSDQQRNSLNTDRNRNRSRDLNRSYNSRNSGSKRYNNRQRSNRSMNRGSMNRGGRGGGGRRR